MNDEALDLRFKFIKDKLTLLNDWHVEMNIWKEKASANQEVIKNDIQWIKKLLIGSVSLLSMFDLMIKLIFK